MAIFKNELFSKGLLIALCIVVLLWFITACVDMVDFDETKKKDTQGSDTSDWQTTKGMFGTSLVLFIGVLLLIAYVIYQLYKSQSASGQATEALAATQQ